MRPRLGVPATDALLKSSDDLVNMVLTAFPQLRKKLIAKVS